MDLDPDSDDCNCIDNADRSPHTIPIIEINEQRLLPAAPIVSRALLRRTARESRAHVFATPAITSVSPPPRPNKSSHRRWVLLPPTRTVGVAPAIVEPQGSPEMAAVTTATRGRFVRAHELPPLVGSQRSLASLRSDAPSRLIATSHSQVSPPIPIAHDAIVTNKHVVTGHPFQAPRQTESYYTSPPDARVAHDLGPAAVRIPSHVPQHDGSGSIETRVCHTIQSTCDQFGHSLSSPRRQGGDLFDSWIENLNLSSPTDPLTDEAATLPDCSCDGCLQHADMLTEYESESRTINGKPRLEIIVTTVVETRVEPVEPFRAAFDEYLDQPFVVNLVQQGYSAFFDPYIKPEDFDALAIPKEPFFENELPIDPVGSIDMLDLVNAPDDVRSKMNFILPPYSGRHQAPFPSRPPSGQFPTTMPAPIQYGFDVSLLHNEYFSSELRDTRDHAWDRVHAVRADFLEFIRLKSWRLTHGLESPSCEETAKLFRADRRSHIEYKRSQIPHAVEQYLIAQRTLECYDDARKIRDREIAQIVLLEAELERGALKSREDREDSRSTCNTTSPTSMGARPARIDRSTGTPDATPPALVAIETDIRTDETTESESGPLSPVEDDPPSRPVSLLTSVLGPSYDPDYRFPRPKKRPTLNMSAAMFLSVPRGLRIGSFADSSPTADDMAHVASADSTPDQTSTPRPFASTSPGDAWRATARDSDDWAQRALEFDHLGQESRPPPRPRNKTRRVSYDVTATFARETSSISRANKAFSRSVDFLLLPRFSDQTKVTSTPAPTPSWSFIKSPPKLSRLQSFSNKLTGRKPLPTTYEPGYQPEENVAPRERQVSSGTVPTGTTRSLNLLRRSNASTLTLPTLDRYVTPEPMTAEDAYTKLVREEAEKERNMSSAQRAVRQWKTFKAEVKIKAEIYKEKLDEMKAKRG